METVEKYWMVHNLNGHGPTKKHYNRDEAIEESKRLAEKELGQVFCVLECISAYCVERPKAEKLSIVQPVEQR